MSAKVMRINLSEEEWTSLGGHVIDGFLGKFSENVQFHWHNFIVLKDLVPKYHATKIRNFCKNLELL